MTEKAKKDKRLPTHVQYSVWITYFVTVIVLALGLSVLLNFVNADTEITRNGSMITMAILAPICGFVFGWWRKWSWTKRNSTDGQFQRVRADFWATLGFVTAFVLGLLAIFITLILLENDALLPQTLSDTVIMLVSGVILLVTIGIAWNTRQRILRNFGY